jgi:hypothetical protein
VATGVRQAAKILQYTRGRVIVVDRPRREEASCGWSHITGSKLDRLLGGGSAAGPGRRTA